MQMSTHHPADVRHIVRAGTIESFEQISAGLSAILLLVEIESERSEGCHNVYSLEGPAGPDGGKAVRG